MALSDRYHAAVGRCTNPRNPAYNNYGELGIEVRFSSAEDWVNYILTLEREGEIEDLDVDRIDNDGHYERGNLRLVPRAENLRNKSTNKFVIYRGQKIVAADLHAALVADNPGFKLSRSATAKLAAEGRSVEQILATRPRRKRK